MRHRIRTIEVVVMFAIFWLVMNEQFNWFMVVTGIIIGVIVLKLTNIIDRANYADDFFYSPLLILRYFPFLIFEIMKAGVKMAAVIITGRAQVHEFIFYSKFRSEGALFLLSTAIILTPGSFAVARVGNRIVVRTIDDEVAGRADCANLEAQIAKMLGIREGVNTGYPPAEDKPQPEVSWVIPK